MPQETTTSRAEHLAWCKQRALEYCDREDPQQAAMSMLSDMSKHPETESHIALDLMTQMMLGGFLNSTAEMRKFIEGFN